MSPVQIMVESGGNINSCGYSVSRFPTPVRNLATHWPDLFTPGVANDDGTYTLSLGCCQTFGYLECRTRLQSPLGYGFDGIHYSP